MMSSSSPLRFLAPGALLAVLLAVFLVIQSGTDEDAVKPVSGATTKQTTTTKGRRTYTVRAGDNLSEIAQRYDLTVDELQDLNPDVDPQAIRAGQRLRLRD